jgi:hypothetical protein
VVIGEPKSADCQPIGIKIRSKDNTYYLGQGVELIIVLVVALTIIIMPIFQLSAFNIINPGLRRSSTLPRAGGKNRNTLIRVLTFCANMMISWVQKLTQMPGRSESTILAKTGGVFYQ